MTGFGAQTEQERFPVETTPLFHRGEGVPSQVSRGQYQDAPQRAGERERQVLFALSGAFNATSEEMTAAKFVYDYGSTQPIAAWWGNPR